MTLDQLIKQAQQRKRRVARRDEKNVATTEAQQKHEQQLASEDAEELVSDSMPRDVRELLDRGSDGMDDVRKGRGGQVMGHRSGFF